MCIYTNIYIHGHTYVCTNIGTLVAPRLLYLYLPSLGSTYACMCTYMYTCLCTHTCIGTLVAPRLLYLPSLGFCGLLAPVLLPSARTHGEARGEGRGGALIWSLSWFLRELAMAIAVVGWYARHCWSGNRAWANYETLFRAALDVCPRSAKVWVGGLAVGFWQFRVEGGGCRGSGLIGIGFAQRAACYTCATYISTHMLHMWPGMSARAVPARTATLTLNAEPSILNPRAAYVACYTHRHMCMLHT